MSSQTKWIPVIAVVGILCLLVGLYSVFNPKTPEPLLSSEVTIQRASSTKRLPPPQPKVTSRDLRGKYGMVNNVIFNETTHVVFTTPQEFFKETGLPSFGGEIDHFTKLPRDCVFVDGTPLTERDYNMLELNR